MEYIVERVGMSRTITNPSIAVTLLRVVNAKVYEVEGGKVLAAYLKDKVSSKCVAGRQKRCNLPAECNGFTTLEVANTEAGDLDETPLNEVKILKVNFNTRGRDYSGVMKGHSFAGGPASHGSKLHRCHGSIGNREWPGRIQPGMGVAGHYGNIKVTAKDKVVSYDAKNKILVVEGIVSGYNGAMGKMRITR